MSKILISGASVSFGAGLPDQVQNKNLFVNQLACQLLDGVHDQIDNISVIGIDNRAIFLETAHSIGIQHYDHVMICWQSIPRINLNLGLETYQTTVPIVSPESTCHDIGLFGRQKISGKKILEIKNYLLRFHNLHWEILELIKYINILLRLAHLQDTKLYFINYSMPWQTMRYFDKINWTIPSELDNFTQTVLQSEFRNDEESMRLYLMIHDHYQKPGGIQETSWLNLYDPLIDMQIDNAAIDDDHPGLASQQVFFDYLAPLLGNR
jgi:hypothetical protein